MKIKRNQDIQLCVEVKKIITFQRSFRIQITEPKIVHKITENKRKSFKIFHTFVHQNNYLCNFINLYKKLTRDDTIVEIRFQNLDILKLLKLLSN